jgi:hypothetical protein
MLHVLVANLTPQPQAVVLDALDGEITLRRLNAETAELAAFDPASFRTRTERLTSVGTLELTLAPFEITRLDAPGLRAR